MRPPLIRTDMETPSWRPGLYTTVAGPPARARGAVVCRFAQPPRLGETTEGGRDGSLGVDPDRGGWSGNRRSAGLGCDASPPNVTVARSLRPRVRPAGEPAW